MLIYHPVHDVNHCVYRTLLILESSIHSELNIDLFRLIDFYLMFPHLIKEIKPFPAELAAFKKEIKNIHEPYENIPNVKRTLFELEAIQTTAIQNLMAKNFIDIKSYRSKRLKRTDERLPPSILKQIKSSRAANEEWFRMLVNEFPSVVFLGKKGLKSRSGMMEFRYDLESV